jgi:hypothetical protein
MVVVAFVEVAFTTTRFVIVEVALLTTIPPLKVESPSTLNAATAVEEAVVIKPPSMVTRPVKVEAPVTESVPPVAMLSLIVVAPNTNAATKKTDKVTAVIYPAH